MIALDLIRTLKKEGIHDIIIDDFEYEVDPVISITSEVVEWEIRSDVREGLVYTDLIIKTVAYDRQFDHGKEYYRKLIKDMESIKEGIRNEQQNNPG